MAVEFVAILPAFLFLTFFVIDTALAVLWVGTVEKAAQLGARLAIVSNVAVSDLPASGKNALNTGTFVPGANCNIAVQASSDPCVRFATRSCTQGSGVGSGPNCNQAGFDAIFARMDSIATMLEKRNVTIKYEYVGLGFAGGPIIPRVTVTVGRVGTAGTAVPYNSLTSAILARLEQIQEGWAGGSLDFSGLRYMPPVSASFTGEDLSSAAAGAS